MSFKALKKGDRTRVPNRIGKSRGGGERATVLKLIPLSNGNEITYKVRLDSGKLDCFFEDELDQRYGKNP